jgi:outer membrane protein TolC
MTKVSASIITLLVMMSMIVNAQEVVELNYQKAKQIALEQNADVQNARLDVQISKHKVWETTAIGLPQVSSGVSYNNFVDIPVTLVPAIMFDPTAAPGTYLPMQFGTKHNGSLKVSASQLVFSGEYIVGLQAAKTYQFLSDQSLEKTEADVVEALSVTYHTLLFAYENVRILEVSKADMQATLNEMKETHKAGFVDQTSVDQIELNLRLMENAIITMNRQIETQEIYLKIQMGLGVNDSIVIRDSLNQVFTASNVEQIMLQEFNLGNNINYQLMNTQVMLQELNLKRERSAYLPTLSAFYSHEQSGQGNDFDFFDSDKDYYESNIVGVSMDWNLFTSGGRNAKIQQQKLELQKMQNTQTMLAEQLGMSMTSSKSELKNAYETYLSQQQNMILAKQIYENAKIQFKAGTISSTDLTTINKQYLDSQTSYYSAMMNVLNAKVALDNILGNK